jgi:hypothetical protein
MDKNHNYFLHFLKKKFQVAKFYLPPINFLKINYFFLNFKNSGTRELLLRVLVFARKQHSHQSYIYFTKRKYPKKKLSLRYRKLVSRESIFPK